MSGLCFSQVTRRDAYCTRPEPWSEHQYAAARRADVVALASPSAAEVWASRVGVNFIAVPIGPTSEEAARKLGFRKVVKCSDSDTSESTLNSFAKTILQIVEEIESELRSEV